MSLDNYDAYSPELVRKLATVRKWASGKLKTGLLLFGKVGAGKTHLAVGALRYLLKRGVKGNFASSRDFLLRCQSAFSRNENSASVVDDLLDGRFLVLDDLGSEKWTDYARQVFLHLVDEAYVREKALVVTTNLSLDELNQFEPRLASRLAEMCLLVEFSESDYRLLIAERRLEANPGEVRGE